MAGSVEERLTRSLSDCEDWWTAGDHFRETVDDAEIDSARPFVFALGYRLLEQRETEQRQVSGFAFGTAWRMNGNEFPPQLGTIDASIMDAWEDYVATADNPIALSRFHDLLWERRHGEAHAHAQTAARAYIELTAGTWTPLNRSFCAMRALELARSIKDQDLILAAIERCVVLAREDMASEEWSPGVALRLIERLVELPQDVRPETARSLVDEAGERYGRDPFIAESVAELQGALSTAEERDGIWRRQVQHWRTVADESDSLLAYTHRQHALAMALNHGLSDLVDEIRVDLQSMTVDELDLKEISTEVSFTKEEMEQYLAVFLDRESWQEALASFGAHGPPTGQVEANEVAVREAAADFPLRWLIPTQVIGPHRSLTYSAVSDEQRLRHQTAAQEGYGLVIFAPLAVRVLAGIIDRFGAPDQDALIDFLAGGLIDRDLATALAEAIGYYWRGEHDAAGHLLSPRIEATVRSLCVTMGIPVTKPQRGEEPGGVLTLGSLLDELEGRMDESWRRYLAHLLVDPLGLNLRNDISHGLIPAVDQYKAALLVHAVSHLAILRHDEPRQHRGD
jgi:hypothetical protein